MVASRIPSALALRRCGFAQLVDLRRQNKIALREPIDLVRPDLHVDLSPRQKNIGMVPFLLRRLANSIDEIERRAEIGKGEALREMVSVDYLPSLAPAPSSCPIPRLPSRNAAAARDAMLRSQAHISLTLLIRLYLRAAGRYASASVDAARSIAPRFAKLDTLDTFDAVLHSAHPGVSGSPRSSRPAHSLVRAGLQHPVELGARRSALFSGGSTRTYGRSADTTPC